MELKAVLFGLQSLCDDLRSVHILVYTDNVTTVSYIKHFGGTHSHVCNNIARQIWLWCINRNLWLTPAHIPGNENVQADKESRIFDDNTEWQLNPQTYSDITHEFGSPTIDLFASRLNYQVTCYASWKPDPLAYATDAFTINWNIFSLCYIFCPFSIIPRVLKKIREDRAQVIMIAPNWTTRPWYSTLQSMTTMQPIPLGSAKDLVTLPFCRERVHPMYKNSN